MSERKDITVVIVHDGINCIQVIQILPVSKHDTGTFVSACRTIQCFIFSAKATVLKLDSVSFYLVLRTFQRKSDEVSSTDHFCPLADKAAITTRSGERHGYPGGIRGWLDF